MVVQPSAARVYALMIRKPLLWHKYCAKEDRDMPEHEAKTKTIGYLPIEKIQSLTGWGEYLDKSIKLSVLRTETQMAKNCVREALKERLSENGDIDFVAEGDRIRVFRVFRKQHLGRRIRSLDLSSSFREENAEQKTERFAVGHMREESEQPRLNLNPTNEEFSANLDPVTERLMAMMKAKTGS